MVPSRRSTAEAFQLLAAHAIGEASAPYLVGLMADAFEAGMDYDYTEEYEYWAMQGRVARFQDHFIHNSQVKQRWNLEE